MKTKILSLALASLMVLSMFSMIFVSADEPVDYDKIAADKGYVCRIGTVAEASAEFDAEKDGDQNGGYFKWLTNGDKGGSATTYAGKFATTEDVVITLIADVELRDTTATSHNTNAGSPITFTSNGTIDGQGKYKITRNERLFNITGYSLTFKDITIESTGTLVYNGDTYDNAASTGANNGVIQTYGGAKSGKGYGNVYFDNCTVLDNSASLYSSVIVGTGDHLYFYNGSKIIRTVPSYTASNTSLVRMNQANCSIEVDEGCKFYDYDPENPEKIAPAYGIQNVTTGNLVTVKGNSEIHTHQSTIRTTVEDVPVLTLEDCTLELMADTGYVVYVGTASVSNIFAKVDNVTFKGGAGVTKPEKPFLGEAFTSYKAAYGDDTTENTLVYPAFYDAANVTNGKVCRIGEPGFAYNLVSEYHEAVAEVKEGDVVVTPAQDAYYTYDRTNLNKYYYATLIDAIKAQQEMVAAAKKAAEDANTAYETAKAISDGEGATEDQIKATADALEAKTAADAALAEINVPIYMISDISITTQFGNSGVTTLGDFVIDGQDKFTITATARLTNVNNGHAVFQNLDIVTNNGTNNGTIQVNGTADKTTQLDLINVEITDNSAPSAATIVIAADSGVGLVNIIDSKIVAKAGPATPATQAIIYTRGADVTLNIENSEIISDANAQRIPLISTNASANPKKISITDSELSAIGVPAIYTDLTAATTLTITDSVISSVKPATPAANPGAIVLKKTTANISNTTIAVEDAPALVVTDADSVAELASVSVSNSGTATTAVPVIDVLAGKLTVYTADIKQSYQTDAIKTAEGATSTIIGAVINGEAQGLNANVPTMGDATLRSKKDGFGLRFTGTISADDMANINSLKEAGYITAISYGTLIALAADVEAVGEFSKDALVAAGKKVQDVPAADGYTENADGSVSINVAITMIDTSNYAADFAALSYMVVTLKNGSIINLYADEAGTGNIKAVVTKALADVKTAPEGLYTFEIKGYYELSGEAYTLNDKTGYTYFGNKQVTALKKFVK